jgi:uncharacterized protein YodC (DUF2158 family)
MDDIEIRAGDVVRLVGGGPQMTVEAVTPKTELEVDNGNGRWSKMRLPIHESVQCVWIDRNEVHRGNFRPTSLLKIIPVKTIPSDKRNTKWRIWNFAQAMLRA